jgi:phosphoribosylamine--glycine ligase
MNVVVLGSGGREHALCHALSRSSLIERLYVIPGNPGMAAVATLVAIDPFDLDEVTRFCKDEHIDLVIPGSEVHLAHGITNHLNQHGIEVFGPTYEAARIETSKRFAKELMVRYGIPTAKHWVVHSLEDAMSLIPDVTGLPVVLKYDGLAGGKGVVVALTLEDARRSLHEMLKDRRFGDSPVVLEEYLEGPEFSLISMVHGTKLVTMPVSQDHKRLLDGDQGPNTGGMGVYSPVPILPDSIVQIAIDTIVRPMAIALQEEGVPFTGFLYAGLMWTKDGPKVIEFNARLGDPETEVILPRIESDLLQVIVQLLDGKQPTLRITDDAIVGVVMASQGYPGTYPVGIPIDGLDACGDTVYHMGTSRQDNQWITAGGRVLLVTGRGPTLAEAARNAYQNVRMIHCDSLIYRKDIAYQSL